MTRPAVSPDAIRARGAALALSEIECLANEMSALMRMGIPLSAGLRELAPTMSGNLSSFVNKLAKRLEAGQDLSAALHEERGRLPIFFKAVIDAGIRSGDPAIALKSIAETARRIDEHRRVEFHAFVYPLVVGLATTGLIAVSLFFVLPWHINLYVAEAAPLPWPLAWSKALMVGLSKYWWAVPLVLGVWFLMLWMRPASWRVAKSNTTWLGIGRLPTLRNIVTCSRWSTMLEVLVQLLKRQVPFDEALSLAGNVALPASMQNRIAALLERQRSGERLTELDYKSAGFPRAIASGLGSPRSAAALIQVLGQLETEYRWRADDLRRLFNGPWINSWTIALAGLCVLAYIVVIILPIVQVYYDVVNNNIN